MKRFILLTACILTACFFAFISTAAEHWVKFDNSVRNFEKPTVWAWVDAPGTPNCNANGSWPGDAMTLGEDGLWYWELPAGKKVPDKIIISDNGNFQSDNQNYFDRATCFCTVSKNDEGEDVFSFKQVVKSDEPIDVTIYYYDKSERGNMYDPHAYLWSGTEAINCGEYVNAPRMQQTGKYVLENGVYYPVYSYSFTTDYVPTGVILWGSINMIDFMGADGKIPSRAKYTSDVDGVFVNGGFYYSDSNTPKEGLTLVDKPVSGEPVRPSALYYSVKLDLEREGRYNADGTVQPPYCDIYNSETGEHMYADESKRLMTKIDEYEPGDGRITDRYAIWKYDIDPDVADRYDAADFYYYTSGGSRIACRTDRFANAGASLSDSYLPGYDKANWTKYIYATASAAFLGNEHGYAAQSYITFDEFMRQHRESVERGGRDRLFFIGEGEGFKYFDSEDNQHDFTDDFRSLPWIENENGCFFLPVLPGADTNITATTKKEPNPTGNRFKMSWIDVASCANVENAVVTDPNFRARCWATFDLGLIGIHEPLYRAESAAKPDERTTYERKIGAGGTTFMTLNKSIRYMNYCQAHWDLPKSDRKHWLIVDTHAADPAVDPTHDCRTVTIAPFDPHPSVKITYKQVAQGTVGEGVLTDIAVTQEDLKGSVANGHVSLDKVNYAEAEADIYAATDDQLSDADFSRTYELQVNNETYATVNGTQKGVKLQYFPLDNEDNLSLCARYTDNATRYSFHSRPGKCELNPVECTFTAPEIRDLEAVYVFERWDSAAKKGHFGVMIKNFNVNFAPGDLNSYADFRVALAEDNTDLTGRAVFYTSAMKMVQQDALKDVAPWNPGDNWSESLFNEANSVPVYLPDMVQAASQTDLPELQLSVVARAVYPFLYDKDAHSDLLDDPSVTTSVPSASRRVYADAVRQLMLHNTILETPMEAVAYPSSVVSSIEEALADGNESPAEYYNLSGMRVGVNPPPGVYIRRRGTVVDKVVIR